MATAKVILDTRNKDKELINAVTKQDNNKYPLKIRIFHRDLYRDIPLNIHLKTKNWVDGMIKGIEGAGRLNDQVQKKFSTTTTTLVQFDSEFATMAVDEIRVLVQTQLQRLISEENREQAEAAKEIVLESNANAVLLKQFSEKLIEEKQKIKNATARWYKDGVSAIIRFNKNKDLPITAINVELLEEFETFMLTSGVKKNSISAYLRAVRSIVNTAIRKKLNGKNYEGYPWGNGGYKIRPETTPKRAIPKEAINDIRKLELTPGSAIANARNYFLFMFNNRGMNFIDLAKLRKSQIVNPVYQNGCLVSGRLTYQRSKNGRQFSMKLTDEAIMILNQYEIYNKKAKDFIFPIEYEETPRGYYNYKQKLKRNNEQFRALATAIKRPDVNITTYVARHSWATIARKSGVSTDIIGGSLGHSDLKVTEIYLNEFENEVLDKANELATSF